MAGSGLGTVGRCGELFVAEVDGFERVASGLVTGGQTRLKRIAVLDPRGGADKVLGTAQDKGIKTVGQGLEKGIENIAIRVVIYLLCVLAAACVPKQAFLSNGPYQVMVANQRRNQPAAVLAKLEQVAPVQLRQKHPHRQPGLRTVLQARNKPLRIVFPIQQMLGIQMRGQTRGIVHLSLPVIFVEPEIHLLDELFDRYRPVLDPAGLAAHDERAHALPLGSADLVRPDAFDQPNGAVRRHILIQTLLQQHLAANTMGDRPAQAAQRNSRIGKILEPQLALGIRQRHARRGLERGRGRDLSVVPALPKYCRKDRRQRRQTCLVLQCREERRLRGLCLGRREDALVVVAVADHVFRELILRSVARPGEEVRVCDGRLLLVVTAHRVARCCGRRLDGERLWAVVLLAGSVRGRRRLRGWSLRQDGIDARRTSGHGQRGIKIGCVHVRGRIRAHIAHLGRIHGGHDARGGKGLRVGNAARGFRQRCVV